MTVFEDERRNTASTRRALARDFVADPDRALTQVEGVRARDARSRAKIRELEAQLERLQSAEAVNRDLTRRLGSATAALDAYRAETARLKGDLKRVRGSRAYRVGRSLTTPVRMLRGRSRPDNTPAPALGAAVAGAAADPAAATSGAVVENSSKTPPLGQACPQDHTVAATTAKARRLSDYTFAELVARFDEQRSPERLGHVITRAWYQQGLISTPAEMLRAHPDVSEALAPREALLAKRILGAERIVRTGLSIPPRSSGVAYRPERGRVMYCAHSTPVFNTNGYSTRTRGVVAGLHAAGVDVSVVGRSGYPWDSAVDVAKPRQARHVVTLGGVDYIHLTGPSLAETPTDTYILHCADAYVREARLQRPSIIHAASNLRNGLAALIAARRLGVPFVYEVRGLWEVTEASDKPGWEETERFRAQADLETLVASEADAVLAITSQTKDELVRRGVDSDRIFLAPNAVDPNVYLPLPKDDRFAQKRGVRTDVPVIGFAGSMVAYEGLSDLIEAAALLRDRGVDFQVALAGSGAAEAGLKELVAAHDLGEHVVFLGRVPSKDMPRLLSLFDIMPCPRVSLPVTEMVSPLKPLEALSCGKAVVLSDVAPHRDIAGGHEERALLFPAGDVPALAETLARLIADPDLRADLGRAGRLWCLDERTWSRLAEDMRAAHAAASRHSEQATQSDSRPLAALRVGLVADEFTSETLRSSVGVVPLDRTKWREQLDGLDLVFIESAWNGNGGQWHRGVGRYSPEEHRDMRLLLTRARELGIPSVFWNKEDPVHFARFVATASLCDHVFTTDANCVLPYLEAGVETVRTASALPFFAQPKIHNPLPGRMPFEPTVAYAGTYYGDRYAKRSKELTKLLSAAAPFGLAIYDRQAAMPDSPYHFPPQFHRSVRGSLPYDRVIDSYKAHLANLNVNSVSDSPSMFSRRVVEVAACGGVVLSGPGRGVDETFGGAIPTSGDPALWRAYLKLWSTDASERLREAWLQMRAVLRSHTADAALTIVARTAGISVAAPPFPSYGVELASSDPSVIESLARQSVLPSVVFDTSGAETVPEVLASQGIRVVPGPADPHALAEVDFVGRIATTLNRTHFEDMLLACDFGPWDRIVPIDGSTTAPSRSIATPIDATHSSDGLVAGNLVSGSGDVDRALTREGLRGVELLMPERRSEREEDLAGGEVFDGTGLEGRRVVVAGHDLKFAGSLIESLAEAGAIVDLDEWSNHVDHDEERSLELLTGADIVFCEWGLGNAVWYSHRMGAHQRLVVRVHSQELRRPYLRSIVHANVDAYVFVGELVRQAAVQSHGVPADKAVVIPNPVDLAALGLPKTPEARKTLGLVGIVPRSKRLDLALDVLERLLERDSSYRLRIKGKTPHDYPWMQQRPTEMDYYDQQYARIEAINARHPAAVVFDGHGSDMAEWYRGIDVALSVSDFESFHLTIADGAASGAIPALLAWPGSDMIYPREWLSPNIPALVERIHHLSTCSDRSTMALDPRFDASRVLSTLLETLNGTRGDEPVAG